MVHFQAAINVRPKDAGRASGMCGREDGGNKRQMSSGADATSPGQHDRAGLSGCPTQQRCDFAVCNCTSRGWPLR
jgi:hypothetical protein